MTFTSKRLATDAAIVLNNAGYVVVRLNNEVRAIMSKPGGHVIKLPIIGGCVDNAEVEKLIASAKQ